MAILQTNRLPRAAFISSLPQPANSDEAVSASPPASDKKIVSWLSRVTSQRKKAPALPEPSGERALRSFDRNCRFLVDHAKEPLDDWQMIASLSGHAVQELLASGMELPLSAAEIDHFRRNHRGADRFVERDFWAARSDLPSPVADLYSLYRNRARLDTEATLFVAQATGSVRVARIMADLLAIGAFASGHECVAHLTTTYAVAAALDTSDLIDRACDEALRRLALPIESPSHLLKLTPDEIGVLAGHIVGRHVLSSADFLEKANLLAEARQDVHRMPSHRRLAAALAEGDLPTGKAWVLRLCEAYARIFKSWISDMPEVTALVPALEPSRVFEDTE